MFINASFFSTDDIQKNLRIYYRCAKNFTSINHFSEALNPTPWRENFNPFAYVFHDLETGDIALVRDHLGMQPLYYYYCFGKFIFGEAIPEILQQLENKIVFNEPELINLFTEQNLYSDETFHKNIYRVEPGHIIHIQPNGRLSKKSFWQLQKNVDMLYYKKDGEYVEHFTTLMQEAVRIATQDHDAIAIEFSGGIDSSAIYCAAASQGIYPEGFLHEPLPNSPASHYDDHTEKAMLKRYPQFNVHRVNADSFDSLAIFQQYAQYFAGPAPHIFYMFAHNVHKAVATRGYKILLSGFGGDQGVSAHLPPRFVLPHLLKQKRYRDAWHFLQPRKKLECIRNIFSLYHPTLYSFEIFLKNIKRYYCDESLLTSKVYTKYFHCLNDAEYDFLQGELSHEIRMRVEYSSIVSKKFGFEYRYPLLYPKLLEFFMRLPLTQKHHNGANRYLMRRYMGQYLPADIFNTYKKADGLHIFPGAIEKFKRNYLQGDYEKAIKNLPYQKYLLCKLEKKRLINTIHSYMIKEVASNTSERGKRPY